MDQMKDHMFNILNQNELTGYFRLQEGALVPKEHVIGGGGEGDVITSGEQTARCVVYM
jgi:hypothetical protein